MIKTLYYIDHFYSCLGPLQEPSLESNRKSLRYYSRTLSTRHATAPELPYSLNSEQKCGSNFRLLYCARGIKGTTGECISLLKVIPCRNPVQHNLPKEDIYFDRNNSNPTRWRSVDPPKSGCPPGLEERQPRNTRPLPHPFILH